MALDGQSYGASEFKLAFKVEANIGTALVTTMQLINIDSLELPELNTVIDFPVKSGTGRTAKSADKFVCEKGTLKSISFSGTADTTVLPMLLSNALTIAVGTSPASYDAATAYTPPKLTHAAASGDTKTLTVAVVSPEGSNSVIFPGCVLQDLVITVGGIDDRNGQAKISGTFVTRYKPTFDQAAPTSMAAYGTTYYYLTDFTTTKTFAGKSNVVLDGLTITISNPSKYDGFQGTDADPESITRGIPKLSVMVDGIVKYDSNTADLYKDFKDGGIAASIELSNNASWASATGFGLKATAVSIAAKPSLNDKTSMYLDVSLKCLDNATNDLIQIIA